MNEFPKYHNSILVTYDLEKELGRIISDYPEDKVFLVTDDNCDHFCLPLISRTPGFKNVKKVIIPPGEENKNLSSVEKIWLFLSKNGADRKSLMINIGGGMVTDLGSFGASTFKRGLDFVNIPTTLLAQVDASVGGKTGFNFNGLKNEIGVINQPKTVLIDTRFLKTIDHKNFLSGYAEMIKHGLIHSSAHLSEVRDFILKEPDYNKLAGIIARSVAIKDYFVFKDSNEKNIRKALNFGHTMGHAFESFFLQSSEPILHGYAVAYGMIAELYLSSKVCNFPVELLNDLSGWIISIYGKASINENEYAALHNLMTHDKKNEGKRVNFTLIPSVGEMLINQDCSRELVFEALDYFRKLPL
jgi:3-dehydroquinate synthase